MARHRRLGRVVVDTSVEIRAARAFRQQPPEPNTPELRIVLAWHDDPEVFTWQTWLAEASPMDHRKRYRRGR